jgi:hypothetical protein
MAAISKADADEILHEYIAEKGFHNAEYEENPGMGLAKKVKIAGKHYDFAVQYGYASNRSRTAATALAKTNTMQNEEFNVVTVESFDAKDVEQKALAEVTSEYAFVDLLTNTVDNVAKSLGNGLGEDLYLDRGAAIGVIGDISSAVLTLENPSHVTRFYVGQVLRVSDTDGSSGSLRTGTVTIESINRDTGALTMTGNVTSGISAAIVGDYIFNNGDFGIGRAGLPAWIPDGTSGLATAFYNATRSKDATRLAGCRQTVSTGANIVASLRVLMARMGREEAKPNRALCSFEMLADLETQIEQKQYITLQGKGVDMGFEAIRVTAGGRRVDFVPDRSCGDDRIYVGNDEVLELVHSQDDVVKIMDEDGEVLARNSGGFSFDIRGSVYANYVVKKPKDWGVLLFT